MTRMFISALVLAFATSLPAMADDVAPKAQAAISRHLPRSVAPSRPTIIDAKGDGYEADDVKCKDGEYDSDCSTRTSRSPTKEKDEVLSCPWPEPSRASVQTRKSLTAADCLFMVRPA